MTALRLGARLWWGMALLVVGLWAGGLLSLPEIPGLPNVPTATLWLLPVAHYARDISAALTSGAIVVGLLMRQRAAVTWFRGWAVVWLAILVPFAVLTVSDAEALSPGESIGALSTFLTGTLVGQVIIAQAILLVAALALSVTALRWLPAVLVVAAAMAPALVGHGGLSSAHVSATASLALHLGAASLWMGGLGVVVAVVAIGGPDGAALLGRFSLLALWCVIIVGESGLLSASLRLGEPSQFTGTLYGSLVLVKAIALGFLIRWGWLQRSRVVTRFSAGGQGARLLALYAGWELALMGAAVALGILLARMGPPDPGSPSSGFTVVSLPVVALAIPLLVTLVTRRRPSWVARIGAYPEAVGIGFLVVVASVGIVGVLGALLGIQFGLIAATVVLAAAGWCWLAATEDSRSWVDVAIVMAAWPVVTWFVAGQDSGPAGGWPLALVSVVASEALLSGVLLRRTRRTVPESVVVAG